MRQGFVGKIQEERSEARMCRVLVAEMKEIGNRYMSKNKDRK